MSPRPDSPLTDVHLSQINNGLASVERAESQIVLAKQAGIDVSEAEKLLQASKTKLLALKRTYFPNG